MNDLDFFDALAKEWQRDTAALEVSRRKAQRRYWMNRLAFAGEFLLGLFGAWTAWFFWQQDATVYTVSALVMFVSIVLSVWIGIRERIPLWHWHDWSPEGVLRYRVQLCESSLRLAAWCRFSSCVLLLFVVYIWVAALADPEAMPASFPAFYTFVILGTVTMLEWWARRQRSLRTRELRDLHDLLQSFDSAR
jgi:hypothetical protein